MRALALAGLLVCFMGGCECEHRHSSCYYDDECYWDDCCGWYCYDVWVCSSIASGAGNADPADLDFEAVIVPQEGGRTAIGVAISGYYGDGDTLLSVMLHGEQASGCRRQSPTTVWWFYNVPAGSVREIEVRLVGQDLSVVKGLPAPEPALLEPLPALRETAGAEFAILRVPDAPRVGDEVPVRGPEIDELAGLNCAGVAVEIVRPDSTVADTMILTGETTAIELDLPGTWTLRPIILARDVQGFSSEDAACLEDVTFVVAP